MRPGREAEASLYLAAKATTKGKRAATNNSTSNGKSNDKGKREATNNSKSNGNGNSRSLRDDKQKNRQRQEQQQIPAG
jgi:hypothetical protein